MQNSTETYQVGKEFEKYVLDNLYPKNQYDLISVSPDITNRMVKDNLNPDIKLTRKGKNCNFWLECKFRSNAKIDVITFKMDQLKRYSELEESVSYVVGLGGTPSLPAIIFLIPISEVFPEMEIWKLERYIFNTPLKINKNFGLWNIDFPKFY